MQDINYTNNLSEQEVGEQFELSFYTHHVTSNLLSQDNCIALYEESVSETDLRLFNSGNISAEIINDRCMLSISDEQGNEYSRYDCEFDIRMNFNTQYVLPKLENGEGLLVTLIILNNETGRVAAKRSVSFNLLTTRLLVELALNQLSQCTCSYTFKEDDFSD